MKATDEMVLAGCRAHRPALFSQGLQPRPTDGPATKAEIERTIEYTRKIIEAALSVQS